MRWFQQASDAAWLVAAISAINQLATVAAGGDGESFVLSAGLIL
jgi:hypothetical protein